MTEEDIDSQGSRASKVITGGRRTGFPVGSGSRVSDADSQSLSLLPIRRPRGKTDSTVRLDPGRIIYKSQVYMSSQTWRTKVIMLASGLPFSETGSKPSHLLLIRGTTSRRIGVIGPLR
jgi:hypothetical protein